MDRFWHSWRIPQPRPVVIGLTVGAFVAGLAAATLFLRGDTPTVEPAHAADLTPASPVETSDADSSRGKPTYVEMRNVLFRVHPEIALGIRRLRGTMRSVSKGPIVFDDPASFVIRISTAEVRMTPENLTNLLNKHVFAYPGAQLKSLSVRIEGNELIQTGRLRKGLSLPFEIRSTVSLTPAGEIKIHATRTKLVGVGATRLMRMLGIKLGSVVNIDKARGARVEGNDIILDVERALPPPGIQGRLTDVRIEGGEMIQTFGSTGPGAATPAEQPVPDPTARNYMFYKGGVLRFGKLMMLDADMQIVDLDPTDAFNFDLTRYMRQLVAGYSRTLSDGGLQVYMKDIDDVASTATTPRSKASGTERTEADPFRLDSTPAAPRPPGRKP